MATTYIFEVDGIYDPAAGIITHGDTVTVIVDSGNPGGEPGEFEQFMCEALADWYDGAKVAYL